MKDNPLISIYMPTWNRQQLAIRAIKSVLRQDYSNWEMIIVDDCSTSWEQLQQYVTALNDPRITYAGSASPLPLSTARHTPPPSAGRCRNPVLLSVRYRTSTL